MNGESSGLTPVGDAQLAQQIGHMNPGHTGIDKELHGELRIGQPLAGEDQALPP